MTAVGIQRTIFERCRWAAIASGRAAPLIDQGIVSGCNFTTNFILVRLLGLEIFGSYAVLWAFGMFVWAVQQAIIISPLMTVGARLTRERHATYFGSVLLHQLALSLAISSIVVSAAAVSPRLLGDENRPAVLFFLGALSAQQIQEVLRRILYVKTRYLAALLFDAVAYGGMVMSVSLAAWLTHSLVWVLASYSTAFLVSLLIVSSRISSMRFSLDASIRAARENWQFGAWLLPTAFLQWAANYLVLIIASTIVGAWAAGVFRAMQNLVGPLHVFFISAENVISTRASLILRDDGKASLVRYAVRASIVGSVGCLVALSPLMLVPSKIIKVVYTEAFTQFSPVLVAFVVLYCISYFGIPLRAALRALGGAHSIFLAYLTATTLNVSTAYFAAERFGVLGLVLSMIAGQIILQLVHLRSLSHVVSGPRQ